MLFSGKFCWNPLTTQVISKIHLIKFINNIFLLKKLNSNSCLFMQQNHPKQGSFALHSKHLRKQGQQEKEEKKGQEKSQKPGKFHAF